MKGGEKKGESFFESTQEGRQGTEKEKNKANTSAIRAVISTKPTSRTEKTRRECDPKKNTHALAWKPRKTAENGYRRPETFNLSIRNPKENQI